MMRTSNPKWSLLTSTQRREQLSYEENKEYAASIYWASHTMALPMAGNITRTSEIPPILSQWHLYLHSYMDNGRQYADLWKADDMDELYYRRMDEFINKPFSYIYEQLHYWLMTKVWNNMNNSYEDTSSTLAYSTT